jgi:penicillin amidase
MLRPALALAVLAVALYVGFRPVGQMPPLGSLLHPTEGVWAVAAQRDFPDDLSLALTGMRDTVRVLVDDRAVPHIFARHETDAFRALGYLHARHRLFQLELQVRATDGTLTELVGERALDLDRLNRRLGLPRAAEREAAALDSTSDVGRALVAYAQGINARIAELTRRDLPLEYRLFDAWPRRWEPRHSFLFVKRMGFTLSYSRLDRRYAELVEFVGPAAAAALVPVNSPIQEPIVPVERDGPRFMAAPIPVPAFVTGAAGATAGPAADDTTTDDGVAERRVPSAAPAASNNWVVSPARSQSGRALLAGDPHLDMTLPAIWYEAHLVVPGVLDVYGATLPGVPAVIVGFNRRVAWSFTNTGNDIIDYYQETLDRSDAPQSYFLDGAWRRLEPRVEVYRDEHGAVLATDTVYYTHRGPLLRDGDRALSMRWAVLEDGGVADGFLGLMRATDVDSWLRAMRRYRVPVQNAVVADWVGNIAGASYGRYPVRPGDGNGVAIRDGATSASDWIGDLPVERQPQARNPSQGFLASANQQPVDPAVDPTYLGADWPSPWRAMRINALLRADTAVTPDAMRRYQTDPGSARADLLLPHFLRAVDEWTGAEEDVRRRASEAAELLRQWDRRYTRENERAVLFEATIDELDRRVWDELAPRFRAPDDAVLLQLLRYGAERWWDDLRTPDVVESRAEILSRSLAAALDSVIARHGPADSGGWRWEGLQHANIRHLMGFPSLSALAIPVQGGPGTLNPISGSGTHGPSWRMVVELGAEVRAWGTYPGGQSGNPASRWYADRIPEWAAGELSPLLFPAAPGALPGERTLATFTFFPEER